MNQQQKEQWLAALRSGKYQQGKGALKNNDNRYCCLGVAEEVCGLKSCSIVFIQSEGDRPNYLNFVFLPENDQRMLADMNDDGKSFAVIADYIEQYIEPTE